MVASGLAPLAAAGSDRYVELALSLALLVGMIKIIMALLQLGFLVNLLGHVGVGYTQLLRLLFIADHVTCWGCRCRVRAFTSPSPG